MSSYPLRATRFLALALPAVVEAQSQGMASAPVPVTVAAVRISSVPIIDGSLSDAAWAALQPLSGFTQRVPRDGEPATFLTDVRIGHDDAALYVGIRAHDDRPELIVPGDGIRDFDLSQSDALVLILDTYNDGVNGFVFGTNPAGIEYDGQVVDQGSGGGGGGGGGALRGGGFGAGRQQGGSGGGFNLNWDGSWEVASSRYAEGWSAEFRIPFSTLRYRAGTRQDWGFNVLRRVRRVNEESFWSPIPREFNLYRVSEAGTLVGLEPPFRRLAQVTPYLLVSSARDYAAGEPDFDENEERGGDAKIQVTQGLTLDLTYNTDFAQVEVDEVQTNLTRFSISFPEKRPFFLENAGMFSVGGQGSDLFFSRRIGISPDGFQVPRPARRPPLGEASRHEPGAAPHSHRRRRRAAGGAGVHGGARRTRTQEPLERGRHLPPARRRRRRERLQPDLRCGRAAGPRLGLDFQRARCPHRDPGPRREGSHRPPVGFLQHAEPPNQRWLP